MQIDFPFQPGNHAIFFLHLVENIPNHFFEWLKFPLSFLKYSRRLHLMLLQLLRQGLYLFFVLWLKKGDSWGQLPNDFINFVYVEQWLGLLCWRQLLARWSTGVTIRLGCRPNIVSVAAIVCQSAVVVLLIRIVPLITIVSLVSTHDNLVGFFPLLFQLLLQQGNLICQLFQLLMINWTELFLMQFTVLLNGGSQLVIDLNQLF